MGFYEQLNIDNELNYDIYIILRYFNDYIGQKKNIIR